MLKLFFKDVQARHLLFDLGSQCNGQVKRSFLCLLQMKKKCLKTVGFFLAYIGANNNNEQKFY